MAMCTVAAKTDVMADKHKKKCSNFKFRILYLVKHNFPNIIQKKWYFQVLSAMEIHILSSAA